MKSRKSIRRAISRLQDRIQSHRKKLAREPEAQAADHWKREIRNFERQVARLRKRLRRS